jgi:hypothetical protein
MSPCLLAAVPVPSGAAEPSDQLQGKAFSLLGLRTAGSVRFGTVRGSSVKAEGALGLPHAKVNVLGQQLEGKAVQAARSLRREAECKTKQPGLAVCALVKSFGERSVLACHPPVPNPSVKGTSTSGLRPLVTAPYVER